MMGNSDDTFDAESCIESKLPELKLDHRQAQGFIRFFKNLPESSQTVRFFDRKDYFTAHGNDAVFVAKTYYRTMTAVRQLGNPPETLASVSISRRLFESILRDLLLEKTDHRVELYEGSGSSFDLTKEATPGKLSDFEEILFANNEMQESPVLMSLLVSAKENERVVGLAFVDTTKRSLGMTEFLEDDQYTNLESALVALGARECILPAEFSSSSSSSQSPETKRLKDVLLRCNCLATERKRSEFKGQDAISDLLRLLRPCHHATLKEESFLSSSSLASGAMAALLSYTDLLGDDSNHKKYSLQPYALHTYMRLDSAALKALNVLESKTDGNKNFSLFGLMDRTCTAGMGRRLLNRWLKQPLVDPGEVNVRLDMVQAFTESGEARGDLRGHLKRVPDVERLARKVERRKAGLKEVVKLYQASIRLPFIRETLERAGGEFKPHLTQRYVAPLTEWSGAEHLGKFEGLVEAAVDLERLQDGEYLISPDYDPTLGEIREERDAVEEEIRAVHESAGSDLGLSTEKSLKLDKNTQHGFVFRITKKEETSVRKKLTSSYVTLETRKDGVKFTNAKLRRLSEKHCQLADAYSSTQKSLVSKVVDVAATFVEVFEAVSAMLAELDVLLSFADLAVSAPTPYTRPTVSHSSHGDIILEGCRHPCVEAQDDVSFIPNDCRMVRGSSWFQIITGPNMGGKSTFIRQVGVNVLMAQVGCFVPCDRAEISVRDAIFARVGAGDCQLRGVSTFMAEMLETASILKAASDRSLIIIDELGRGTSTYDGFGLAWAICEHLVEVTGAPTLFATHFHELTSLAHSREPRVDSSQPPVGIANYHVSAHIDEESRKLTMLYKVEEGPCDQSFGIHVAEFAHFPESVVKLAQKKAAELEDFSPPTSITDVEVGRKRKRVTGPDDAVRGAARARQFLRDFAALPLDEMDAAEACREVEQLKASLDVDAACNPWLQELCNGKYVQEVP